MQSYTSTAIYNGAWASGSSMCANEWRCLASSSLALWLPSGDHRKYSSTHAETKSVPNVGWLLSAETEYLPEVLICLHSATLPKSNFSRPLIITVIIIQIPFNLQTTIRGLECVSESIREILARHSSWCHPYGSEWDQTCIHQMWISTLSTDCRQYTWHQIRIETGSDINADYSYFKNIWKIKEYKPHLTSSIQEC